LQIVSKTSVLKTKEQEELGDVFSSCSLSRDKLGNKKCA